MSDIVYDIYKLELKQETEELSADERRKLVYLRGLIRERALNKKQHKRR